MALRGSPICSGDELPLLRIQSNICVCVLICTLQASQGVWSQFKCLFDFTFNHIGMGEVQHNLLLE